MAQPCLKSLCGSIYIYINHIHSIKYTHTITYNNQQTHNRATLGEHTTNINAVLQSTLLNLKSQLVEVFTVSNTTAMPSKYTKHYANSQKAHRCSELSKLIKLYLATYCKPGTEPAAVLLYLCFYNL